MLNEMSMENGGGDANGSNVSPTKLMVNYIPELMTRDMMYALFSAMGKIESCKLIANRGYGFVEYEKHEDAEKARAAFNGLLMQGKTLKVSFALLNPENKASHKPDTESNLYISNLPPDMTLERLNALFGPFGHITNSRVSQGIGFVCYESRPQAEEAIAHMHGQTPIPGAGAIAVKFANKPSAKAGRARAGLAAPLAYNGAAVFNGAAPAFNGTNLSAAFGARPSAAFAPGFQQASPPPLLPSPGKALPFINKGQQRFNPMAATNHSPLPLLGAPASPVPLLGAPAAPHQTTVYVYNIGEDAEELTLWQLFGPYGAIDSIKVIKDPETKKNKGFAFVNMREYDEAAMAIQGLNGYTLNGQVLSVSFKTQKRN
ncbi:ELAV-like protein 1-B [Pararge aegeria]|uniref:Jg3942 protein n=2 Tax=Pararge aegeria TaxID=116150 RepID=A0A8S4RX06_9NEOP|nr:ELAV-like protein 1-B [Pararge aegeria]CAH2241608.1 jg3942 [Pararge aegeria aegeria]